MHRIVMYIRNKNLYLHCNYEVKAGLHVKKEKNELGRYHQQHTGFIMDIRKLCYTSINCIFFLQGAA